MKTNQFIPCLQHEKGPIDPVAKASLVLSILGPLLFLSGIILATDHGSMYAMFLRRYLNNIYLFFTLLSLLTVPWALALGIASQWRIKKNPFLRGKRYAMAGSTIAATSCLLLVAFFFFAIGAKLTAAVPCLLLVTFVFLSMYFYLESQEQISCNHQ